MFVTFQLNKKGVKIVLLIMDFSTEKQNILYAYGSAEYLKKSCFDF